MARTGSLSAQPKKGEMLHEWIDGQIDWYDRKAQSSQRAYKVSKATIIVLALAIPVLAEYSIPLSVILAAGGILLIEALQQINRWQEHWILYRTTCEGLRHEERMYLNKAGAYTNLRGPSAERALAERTGALVMAEHSRWMVAHREKTEMTTEG